ncbi:MAG: hypothetical protein AB7Q81_05865 [Gammaproteobacteria bacterium]
MLKYIPARLRAPLRQHLCDFIDSRVQAIAAARAETAGEIDTIRHELSVLESRLAAALEARTYGLIHPSPPGGTATPGNAISRSLDEAVAEVRARGLRRIAVCGDASFHSACAAALAATLPDIALHWVSLHVGDLGAGAQRLRDLDLANVDGCVVGGRDVRVTWTRLVREMAQRGCARPAFWVAEGFEFCVGQVTFPAAIEAAQAYLFNHFDEYFHLREPLLIELETYDGTHGVSKWLVMRPNESLRIDLDDYLPQRRGAAAIAVAVTAPQLTGGRHMRWRFCADIEWRDSLASLHGAHDVTHATAGTEFMQARSGLYPGEVAFTLPNHYRDMRNGADEVNCLDGRRRYVQSRDRSARIDELSIVVPDRPPEFEDFVGASFDQYTTPFWYAFGSRPDGGNCLSANHIQGHAHALLDTPNPAHPFSASSAEILAQDVLTWPYAVPVLKAESALELGLSFDSSWPALRQFLVRAYDADGHLLEVATYRQENPGVMYADALVDACAAKHRSTAAMLLIAPDWAGMNLDPQTNAVRPLVDFVLRHRHSGDFDVTEFQNSWRNLDLLVEDMPHWISPGHQVLGGTNLYGRAVLRQGWRTGVLLVNASGNLRHDRTIDYRAKLFNREGAVIESSHALAAFTWELHWLDELFPNCPEHFGNDSYGAMTIRSRSGDLLAQLVTVTSSQAVALQHMWGY